MPSSELSSGLGATMVRHVGSMIQGTAQLTHEMIPGAKPRQVIVRFRVKEFGFYSLSLGHLEGQLSVGRLRSPHSSFQGLGVLALGDVPLDRDPVCEPPMVVRHGKDADLDQKGVPSLR